MEGDNFRSLGHRSYLPGSFLNVQGKSPSFVCGSETDQASDGPTEEESPLRRSQRDAFQESCSKMPNSRTGLLCSSFCSAKEERRLASMHRSEPIKQVLGSTSFQDGDCPVYKGSASAGGICYCVGPAGCIFPHSHKTKLSEVPEVLYNGSCIQISDTVLRSSLGTEGLYHGDEVHREVCTQPRHEVTCLSGRLATQKSLSRHSFGPTEEVARSSSEIRNSSQLSQVEFDSETDLRLSRGKIQSCKGTSLPNSGVSVKTQSLDRVLPDSASSSSKSIIVFSGSAQSSRRFDSTGKVTYQTYPMVSQMLLQTSCGSSLQEDSPETSIFSVPSVLEKSGFFTSRQPSASASGAGIGLHRCQSVRLGCSAEQSDSSRSMESARFRTPFQHSGNDGHDKRASEFSGTCKSEGRHVCFRQSHCSVSCTETGRDSFLDSVFQDSPVVSVGGTVGSNSQSSMDARKGSHRSGLFEPITSSYGGGMVFTRCSIPQTADSFSGDEDRSLCNFIQSETASFCKSQSGSRSTGSGCVFYLLGRLDSLCLSSNKVVTSSSSQNRAGSSLHPSDSASLARPSVVSNYPQSVDRLSEETSVPQETSVTEEWENVSFQPSETASSRLAIIKRSLQEKGFSEEVSERASLANRESTRSIYDSRFSKFSEWCKSRQRPLAEVTIQEIADFLLELFEKGLLVNTIKGYRSAISSAMGLFEGVTVGSHPVISKLINGFEVQRPVCRSYFPCWDLNVVLRVLMKSPFEPPSFNTVQDRKYTTWKTVFLIALASAKRASEIHAISRSKRDLIFLKDGVQLRAIPGFLGKTQSASYDAKPYTIADHQQFVGRDTVDRLLCPKRMLKYYLNFTGSFKSQSRLFFKCIGEGEVKKSTVSSWLKSVISYAYEHSEEVLSGSVSGHDVRRMSTSCSFAAGTRLKDILEAAEWKKSTTFTCHYLKDIEPQPDGMYRLGAVLAGAGSKGQC